jgi:hypothetical protein
VGDVKESPDTLPVSGEPHDSAYQEEKSQEYIDQLKQGINLF